MSTGKIGRFQVVLVSSSRVEQEADGEWVTGEAAVGKSCLM